MVVLGKAVSVEMFWTKLPNASRALECLTKNPGAT